MSEEEEAIRTSMSTWMAASASGDLPTVLGLMAEDVVFLVPGKEPFGKSEFASMSKGMAAARLDVASDIKEITVKGDWAWTLTHLSVTITPPSAEAIRRAGYAMTIWRKDLKGTWVVARDANLLAAS